jgi:integrating conjugative element protein (TIGR03752 family)
MKANALLKWLVPGVLMIVVLILAKTWVGNRPPPAQTIPDSTALSQEQAKALGINGDTPRDTVATLVGQVKAMRSDMLGLKQNNETLQTENQRLRQRESSVDSRVQSSLNDVTQQFDEGRRRAEVAAQKATEESRQARGLLAQFQQQLAGLSNKNTSTEDLPIGLGLEPGDGQRIKEAAPSDTLIWIESADGRDKPASPGKRASLLGLPAPFGPMGDTDAQGLDPGQHPLSLSEHTEHLISGSGTRTEGAKPVYTLPENATLMGSVAMTALIGRVPVDGTVNDPYPFKVLVGAQNLAANGLDLPDVAGAVMSGTASGDWTLSCVRGQIESITFVFHDGTIRTVPPPQPVASRNTTTQQPNTTDKVRGGLGYLSDPYGIPCIAGERRSNAQQYIGSQSLITAAGAGLAAVLAKDDQTSSSVISSGAGTVGVTSSTSNAALNTVLSGGISDIREWVNRLYGEAFAAVYVPPSAQVALHLDHEITLDYEPKGRRLRHDALHSATSDLD